MKGKKIYISSILCIYTVFVITVPFVRYETQYLITDNTYAQQEAEPTISIEQNEEAENSEIQPDQNTTEEQPVAQETSTENNTDTTETERETNTPQGESRENQTEAQQNNEEPTIQETASTEKNIPINTETEPKQNNQINEEAENSEIQPDQNTTEEQPIAQETSIEDNTDTIQTSQPQDILTSNNETSTHQATTNTGTEKPRTPTDIPGIYARFNLQDNKYLNTQNNIATNRYSNRPTTIGREGIMTQSPLFIQAPSTKGLFFTPHNTRTTTEPLNTPYTIVALYILSGQNNTTGTLISASGQRSIGYKANELIGQASQNTDVYKIRETTPRFPITIIRNENTLTRQTQTNTPISQQTDHTIDEIVRLGTLQNTTGGFEGFIVEALIYKKELTERERKEIYAYREKAYNSGNTAHITNLFNTAHEYQHTASVENVTDHEEIHITQTTSGQTDITRQTTITQDTTTPISIQSTLGQHSTTIMEITQPANISTTIHHTIIESDEQTISIEKKDKKTEHKDGIYIRYEPSEPTTSIVTATLAGNMDDITLHNNNGNKSFIFTGNGEFTFKRFDKFGQEDELTATVDRIHTCTEKEGCTQEEKIKEEPSKQKILTRLSKKRGLLYEGENLHIGKKATISEDTILTTKSQEKHRVEVFLPQKTQIHTEKNEPYTGTLHHPTLLEPTAEDLEKNIHHLIQVGSEDTSLHFTDENNNEQPITITTPLRTDDIDERYIQLYYKNPGDEEWSIMEQPDIIDDSEEKYIQFTTTHFTTFGLGVFTGTFTINSDNNSTTTGNVTLNSIITGATQMRFGNTPAARDLASRTGYSTGFSWSLSTGDGIKTVYAMYQNASGVIAYVKDSIILDTQAASFASGLVRHINGFQTGALFQDFSVNNFHATNNLVTTGSQSGETIMIFNGTTSYAQRATPIVTAYPFTISAWVKSDTTAAGQASAVNLSRSTSANIHSSIGRNGSSFQIMARNGGAGEATLNAGTIDTTKRYHIVGIFESNTSRTLYIDGVSAGTNTTNRSFNNNANNRRSIGRMGDKSPNRYRDGNIDEVRVYNRSLTSGEILNLYRPPATCENLTTNDTTPTLQGTITRNDAQIRVTISGSTYTGINNGSGKWILSGTSITTPLNTGTYNLTLTIQNIYGKTGNIACPNALTVNTGIQVTYSKTGYTAGKVIAYVTGYDSTLTFTNTSGGIDNYTFTNNGSFTFQHEDLAGNTGSITATVDRIIKPLSDGQTLRFDAEDEEGVILTGTNSLLQRTDKSGNGNHGTQSNSGNRPTRQLNSNGKQMIIFDGVNDYIDFPEVSDIRTSFIVAYETSGAVNDRKTILSHSTVEPDYHRGSGGEYQDNYRGSPSVRDGQAFLNGTAFAHTGTLVTNIPSIYTVITLQNARSDTIGRDRLYTGRERTGGYAELILYNKPLSETERKSVECYLSKKRTITLPYSCTETIPTATVTYSTTLLTTGNVTATLTGFSEPVTIINNSGSNIYTFTGNGTFTFTFVSSGGVTGQTVATVERIYKDIPVTDGALMWLDASETGTVMTISGEVNERRDKSGNEKHAFANNGVYRPTKIGSGQNGKPTIRFSGAGRYLQFPNTTNIRSVFIVAFETTGATNTRSPLLGHTTQTDFLRGTGRIIFDTGASSNIRSGATYFNGSGINPTSTNIASTMGIYSIITTGNVTANLIGSDRLLAGRYRTGDFAEIIMYNRALSDTERKAIECYLATKRNVSVSNCGSGVVTISAPTGFTFTGTITATTIEQHIQQSMLNYFRVDDGKGADTGYYTTISISNLTGAFGTIQSGTISLQATGITLLAGTANPNVSIATGLASFTPINTPITFIKRDAGPNGSIIGRYGTIPQIKVDIPGYQTVDAYQGIMTFTIYE